MGGFGYNVLGLGVGWVCKGLISSGCISVVSECRLSGFFVNAAWLATRGSERLFLQERSVDFESLKSELSTHDFFLKVGFRVEGAKKNIHQKTPLGSGLVFRKLSERRFGVPSAKDSEEGQLPWTW